MASKPGPSGRKSPERPWEDITPEEWDTLYQRAKAALRAACDATPAELRFEMEMLCSFGEVAMRRQRPKRLHVVDDHKVPAGHTGYRGYWGE